MINETLLNVEKTVTGITGIAGLQVLAELPTADQITEIAKLCGQILVSIVTILSILKSNKLQNQIHENNQKQKDNDTENSTKDDKE